MAASVVASDLGDKVVLIEKNNALGKKIAASGNGRCNLMNSRPPVYYGDSDFAESILHYFSKDDLIRFWNDLGLYLTEDQEGRLYPCTFQSASVLDALKTRLSANNVSILLNTEISALHRLNSLFYITSKEKKIIARRVLVACGGAAFPRLGASSSGYAILESLGHHISPPFASLCPLCTDPRSISGLAGIRIRCTVSLYDGNHTLIHRENGEVLFTEYGISGICVMQCARFADKGYTLELDLAKRLFPDKEILCDVLKKRKRQISSFSAEKVLNGILVPKLSYAVLKQAGISMKGKTAGDLTNREIQAIADRMYCYTLQITGTRGLDDAQVTAGGAVCSEFYSETLESRIVPGLYASGEVLNIDGDCGGYNLMFAFASGILAGLNGRNGKDLVS